MPLTKECVSCGRGIRDFYTHCYKCHTKKEEADKYKPEHVPWVSQYDYYKGQVFQTYILDTDYGHYVGHTSDLSSRVRQHHRNHVLSTADGNPKLIWSSEHFNSRHSATGYESALKAFRDFNESRYEMLTGLTPKPFLQPSDRVRVFNEEFVFASTGRAKKRGIPIIFIIALVLIAIGLGSGLGST